jgi:hypothetical protein
MIPSPPSRAKDLNMFLEDLGAEKRTLILSFGLTQGQGFGSALCFGRYRAV